MSRVAFFGKIAVVLLMFIGGLAQAAPNVRVIRNDPGGNVNEYLMNVSMAVLTGETIRIDGWCASACTLYLGSTNTCVTRSANFGFHAPRGGSAADNRHAAQVISTRLPAPLGQWYLQNAAFLPADQHVTLSGRQLVQMGAARYCR
ncbi:hypothetical protein BVC71_15160 [Marivivens niveibacter]|uniref:Uncharacterized protein n=1 Tax=Marivivens niveibacter TaxID=1930667 RepID=A0A251WW01_9RHOB|nr:hypothetical protein [Marivivens niveibacter]OUD08143.1 hypothetical protein BVC71_15160 [Marivivens niveibacter]